MDLYTLFLKKLYLPIRRNTYGETQQKMFQLISSLAQSQ